jgi:hypothetical protein
MRIQVLREEILKKKMGPGSHRTPSIPRGSDVVIIASPTERPQARQVIQIGPAAGDAVGLTKAEADEVRPGQFQGAVKEAHEGHGETSCTKQLSRVCLRPFGTATVKVSLHAQEFHPAAITLR